jgi:hypothetical protein
MHRTAHLASKNTMTQISSPNNSILLLGRILMYSDSDFPTAYELAKKIQFTPLSGSIQ